MIFAFIHFRAGTTDGVSLEMMKWKDVLVKLGHKVIFISGNNHLLPGFLIKELDLNSLEFKSLFNNCFVEIKDFNNEEHLKEKVDQTAILISEQLVKIIKEEKVDVIIPNNLSSLGLSLAAGKAISMAQQLTGVKTIYHHHDFHWERERYSKPTASFVSDYLSDYFPPRNYRAIHCVINRLAKTELKVRYDVDSIVVPNVIDFNQPIWNNQSAVKKLRAKLEINDHDLVFLQATRVEDRKAIELAIDVVDEIVRNKDILVNKKLYNGKVFNKDSKIYLLVAGLNELREDKFKYLKEKSQLSLAKILYINDIIVAEKPDYENDKFLLWDAYQIADFVTYPSILEGWGNQLIEAIFARKPVLIFEYPVFVTDLKKFNLNLVSLGSSYVKDLSGLATVDRNYIINASKNIVNILLDKTKYVEITTKNYDTCQAEFSYQKLEEIILDILDNKFL